MKTPPVRRAEAVIGFVLAIMSFVACGIRSGNFVERDLPRNTQRLVPAAVDRFGRCREHTPERRPLFGELHLHTRYSLDANLQGNRTYPDDAYRFARGETIRTGPLDEAGVPTDTIRIDRPLDFAAVTDHAEFIGFIGACSDPGSRAYRARGCQMFRGGSSWAFTVLNMQTAQRGRRLARHLACGRTGENCDDYYRDLWIDTQNAAERHYDHTRACNFTTFIGYEYTANPFTGVLGKVANMHRNVIFRGADVPDRPVDYFETQDVRVLWRRLEEECRAHPDRDCDAIVIPHNSNLSGGAMFAESPPGLSAPYTADENRLRADLERLIEIYQHKGSSECLPGSPTGDELCDFEVVPYDNLRSARLDRVETLTPQNFVRDAFGMGMRIQRESGVNPFAYGIVASTDNHLGLTGNVHEARFVGGGGAGEGRDTALPDRLYFGPGGLAGVWAEENSRPAIFEALRRKETFGTSGPRIPVRLFATWRPLDAWCGSDPTTRARLGYDNGVPMGGTMPTRPAVGTLGPHLYASATYDPGTAELPGVPLQQLELVKGWLDADDQLRIETHLLAGDPTVGSVNSHTCVPTHEGDFALCGAWQDPDFDPNRPAFYYVRALQPPTCRWSTLICNRERYDCDTRSPRPIDEACCDPRMGLHAPRCFDVECGEGSTDPCCARDVVRPTIRERAWSSPIWYVPPGWTYGSRDSE